MPELSDVICVDISPRQILDKVPVARVDEADTRSFQQTRRLTIRNSGKLGQV